MRFLEFMRLLACAWLAAAASTSVFMAVTAAHSEEAWTIAAASEFLILTRLTFVVAAAHALLLGLPLFYILRSTRGVGLSSIVIGGFLVGAVPIGILGLITMTSLGGASSGGIPTVVNGRPTLAGWIEYAEQIGAVGLLGTVGAVAFWLAARFTARAMVTPGEPIAQAHGSHGRSWSLIGGVTLLTSAILLLPWLVRDTSCHNLFRDGRASATPQVVANMKLSADDWEMLSRIFMDFGTAHALSVRTDERVQNRSIVWRDLNLCNENGIYVDAIDQPWLARTGAPHGDRGVALSVFEFKPGSEWKGLARELFNKIELNWPGRIAFRDPHGHVISLEDALKGRD